MARRIQAVFEAEEIPCEGYKVFALVPGEEGECKTEGVRLVTGECRMENAHIRVEMCIRDSLGAVEGAWMECHHVHSCADQH